MSEEQQSIQRLTESLEKYSDQTDSFCDKSIPKTANLGFMNSSEWKGRHFNWNRLSLLSLIYLSLVLILIFAHSFETLLGLTNIFFY